MTNALRASAPTRASMPASAPTDRTTGASRAFAWLLVITGGLGVGTLAGARCPRWFRLGLNAGTLFGAGFCMWLMTQALYEIGALCLWCCLAWAATIVPFRYSTSHNLGQGILPAPKWLVAGVTEFRWAVPIVWCGSIPMPIATRFRDYWQSLL